MPQAVSIVEFNENSKPAYTLNVTALKAILGSRGNANKKVAVISIAGAFRKGKSFLLNFFIAYIEWLMKGQKGEWLNDKTPLDKFHYKGGSQRDTNGILMWDTPYQFKAPNGEQILVFIMDTQGTFDHQSSVYDCTTIFALSTLLSSVQIFNVSGQIQEDDLNNLCLFAEYAKLAGHQENQTPFQKLLFLIRDWSNSQEIDYGFEGGQKYLNDVMAITSQQREELQNVRRSLKSSFRSLEAFLMPHPGLTIAQNNSQKVLGGRVKNEFLKQMRKFIPSFFSDEQLVPKTINGKSLTCGELLELFKAYMEIFNSTELPKPQTILEATVKAVLVAAEQAAKKEYDGYMDQKMNEEPNLTCLSTLENLHREAKSLMWEKFSERPNIGDGAAAGEFEKALRKYCEEKYKVYMKIIKTVEELLRAQREAQIRKQEEEERIRRQIRRRQQRRALTIGLWLTGAAAAAAAAPVVISAAVTALGFEAGGIAAGSVAAWMMSLGGGTTPAIVAVCQSIGATGAISATTQVAVGGVVCGVKVVKDFWRSLSGSGPNDKKANQAKADAVDNKSNTSKGSSDSGVFPPTTKPKVNGTATVSSPKTHRKAPSASSISSQEESIVKAVNGAVNGLSQGPVTAETMEKFRAEMMAVVRLFFLKFLATLKVVKDFWRSWSGTGPNGEKK